MLPVLSVDQVRWAEGAAGVEGPVLMQRAAFALATHCGAMLREGRGRVTGARVSALVGSGNNGGDALWALAMLARRGVSAVAIADPGRCHVQGALAARAAGVRLAAWEGSAAADAVAGADLLLDAMVGIGATGALRGPAAGAVARLDAAGTPVVAVDLPSGLDPMTGHVPGVAVRAHRTVTFGALKPGLLVGKGRRQCGSVQVADIGLPLPAVPVAHCLDVADLELALPAALEHKYRRGVVEVVAGGRDYPGAAVLCIGGARASGAGMVALTSSEDQVRTQVIARFPDVVAHLARPPHARVVGPGLGTGQEAARLLGAAIADPVPLVVDASALTLLAQGAGVAALRERAQQGWLTVLTPHAGEFARLFGAGDVDPFGSALAAAALSGCVVVAKGPGTVVAGPHGRAFVDRLGEASLATAGTGDVLAGLVAGMLAVRFASRSTPVEPELEVARAVSLHGLAGQLASAGGGPVTAVEVLAALAPAIAAGRAAG